MVKDIINLYISKTANSKSNILLDSFLSNNYVRNSTDYKIIIIDSSNDKDTNLQLLFENSISDLPVMLINNTFYSFNKAMAILKLIKRGVLCD